MDCRNTKHNSVRSVSFTLLTSFVLSAIASAATPKVTTVAGGYVGNGKPATSASFAAPAWIARDTKGNLYVSDRLNCRIRKISTKGIISNVAGTGICGYNGDGRSAQSTMLSGPGGLAFDGKGNLLFADTGNQRIRMMTPAATISTIAGNGSAGYSGDGGPATAATFRDPNGVALDALGNILIADTFNCVIRVVDTAGVIHTVAGNHTCGFWGDGGPATSASLTWPYNVLADANGNFYIADSFNYRVRKVDSNGIITTYAGSYQGPNGGNGGPATAATFGGTPSGLSLGGDLLYIAAGNNVWAVDLNTQIINIVAGDVQGGAGFNGDGQPALSTLFLSVSQVASDPAGNLFIADAGNNRIRKVDVSQIVTTIGGGYVGDGGKGTAASLSGAGCCASGSHFGFDATGNLYIADTDNHRIRKVSSTGIISTFAGTGILGYTGDGGPATSATLAFPNGVAADALGNVYISDGNGVIRKVDAGGTITTFANVFADGLAVDPTGNVYAAGDYWCVVWKIAPDATVSIVAGTGQYGYNGDGIPATQAQLATPDGVAVDKAGNLYIADLFNSRIRMVNPSGIISTVAGNGDWVFSGDGGPATAAGIGLPVDVAIDFKGNFYEADLNNFRVRVVDSAGIINTLAGTGRGLYNGNGLPATATNMEPAAINVSPKGIVYVSDSASYRVRKIH